MSTKRKVKKYNKRFADKIFKWHNIPEVFNENNPFYCFVKIDKTIPASITNGIYKPVQYIVQVLKYSWGFSGHEYSRLTLHTFTETELKQIRL